ncbi:glycosyltransferase [Nitrosovibrio tenuis]|nr:glycosyltransferase [Nitrosovibrio tenuis]
MIDAIKQNCSVLNALFFLRHDDDYPDEGQLRAIEFDLTEQWGLEVRISFCRREAPDVLEPSIGPYLKSANSFFRLPGYKEFSGVSQIAALDRCLEQSPRLIFVHRLHSMPPLMRTKRVLPPVFLDLDDIEHIAVLRTLSQPPHWWRKKVAYLHFPALVWGERKAIESTRATFVCSDIDQRKLARLFHAPHVTAIPNAVALPLISTPSHQPIIAMLGNYEFAPNRQGVEFFLNHVWPLILARFPKAEVIFAGRRAEVIQHYAHPPHQVSFPGFVKDLDSLYQRAQIVICPILSGAGTRVKIMEAAAYARPVVSTTIGAEGINLVDGKEILLRDTAESFADACVELLKNYDAAKMLGLAARAAIESRYDRGKIVARLAGVIRAAITQNNRQVGASE